jgi:hypothetical protein
MSLKIPGIEQQNAQTGDDSDTPREIKVPSESVPAPPQEPELVMRSEPPQTANLKNSKSFAGMSSLAALVLSVAAFGYAFTLQQKMEVLKARLATAQATANTALKTSNSLPAPKDFTPDITRVEATVISKFRVTDEYLQKTMPEEIKKSRDLEARLAAENKETSNSLASIARAIEQVRQSAQKNEQRCSNVVTILRNQDKVLRRVAQKETPNPQ